MAAVVLVLAASMVVVVAIAILGILFFEHSQRVPLGLLLVFSGAGSFLVR